jgi:solute:Na+ symporter, SSS family
MSNLDWIVLIGTLLFVTIYGIYKSRKQQNLESYLLGDKSLPWYQVMFSVVATQASAITFLSAPGQAYTDGMRFVQFYFGMPLAMIVVAAIFLPRYNKLNVYTAYEFLEKRFNVQTRVLAAFLFLLLRGLSSGLTIYAPALILSSLLGWNIFFANIMMGSLVILYTVSGGSKAVSVTQFQQMIIVSLGMLIAGVLVVQLLPEEVGFIDALTISGSLGKLNTITTSLDFNDKYNVWSGLLGGFFLSLAYFGTDQSQVSRYLSGKSLSQSKIGLLMTGFVKIPMQFLILLIGALLVAFYQFTPAPLFFNQSLLNKVKQTEQGNTIIALEAQQLQLSEQKKTIAYQVLNQPENNDAAIAQLNQLNQQENTLRAETKTIIKQAIPLADTNDTNYIFLDFVMRYLPQGLIGLLIAVIFCASWSSTSSELNALASTTIVDVYKRLINKNATDRQYVTASRITTLLWGLFAIGVAQFASALGSLIEAVNVLGSLFYGTILGIFLTAFFLKKVKGNAVFYAAIISETIIIGMYIFDVTAFLWLNLIGCGMVMGLSFMLNMVLPPTEETTL